MNDCVFTCSRRAVKKLLRTSQKKEIKERVAIGAFRSILFLPYFFHIVIVVVAA